MAVSFYNASLGLVPSPSDLYMVFPRLGSHIANLFSWRDGLFITNATNATGLLESAAAAAALAGSNPTTEAAGASSLMDQFMHIFARVGNFDGVFSYVASRWALSTILLAFILNRAHVYASTREHLDLTWKSRLLLRLAPTLLLLYQILRILQTLRCQTGMKLPEIRFTGSDTILNKSWVSEPGLLSYWTSKILFWEDATDSCNAVNMLARDEGEWVGSTAVLWPLFLILCLSHLVETTSSALQGRQPHPETGVTIFEHSLAFAEAETVVRTSVGIGLFGLPPPTGGSTAKTASAISSATAASTSTAAAAAPTAGAIKKMTFTRAMILSRLNVPPEVLLISLISACSHLSSQVLGILGVQSRYRLLNTAIWAILFMSLFMYSFISFSGHQSLDDIQIIRYPTVLLVGFIPHLLVVIGTLICSLIYGIAILATLLSAPARWENEQPTFLQRLKLAHANMSASTSLSEVRFRPYEDFYTFLLKLGYKVMSAAAESVYFHEGLQVTLGSGTWIEKQRLDELAKAKAVPARSQARTIASVPLELQNEFAAGDGFGLVDEAAEAGPDGAPMPSGYAKERKTMKTLDKSSFAAIKEEGVGISQRSGRWYMSWKLVEQSSSLVGYCLARLCLTTMQKVSGYPPPMWLLRLGRVPVNVQLPMTDSPLSPQKPLDFWMLSDAGELSLPKNRNVDVEEETRKRMRFEGSALDDQLYGWWRNGGWWGDLDSSGDYRPAPSHIDDDLTSVLSETTSAWETDEEDSSGSGARTPTQSEQRTRESTPMDNGLSQLAQLLDPKNVEDRQQAKLLSLRLRHSQQRPMTRSQYARIDMSDRTRMIASSLGMKTASHLLSPEEEELVLEEIIVARRRNNQRERSSSSWADGGDGMGSAGPQCAICHSAPRTVLVWPCRCLSLCEECRVNLAVNNFGSCVCCRRDVVAFSKLFVP